MHGYLSADIICSEKRTVFRERSSRKTLSFEEHIFAPNGDYCVYYSSNLFRNFSESASVDEISSVDWQVLFQHDSDPSKMLESFHRILTQIVDKHIPIKQLSRRELKSYSKPWITSAIKTSIRVKNAPYKKLLKVIPLKLFYYQTFFETWQS